MAKKGKGEKRNFALRDEQGNEIGVFSGIKPRQAALKAANRYGGTKDNPKEIRLREKGTKKVHVFLAWKETIDAPPNAPSWIPSKIHKPFVKKLKVEHLDKI